MFETLSLSKKDILVWIAVLLLVSLCAGATSALFLHALQWVGEFRESHLWIIWGLPVAGILIVYLYKTYGSEANKGNNLLFEKILPSQNCYSFYHGSARGRRYVVDTFIWWICRSRRYGCTIRSDFCRLLG